MINALVMLTVVALVVTALEWRWLVKSSAATRWLFGLLLLLSIGLYGYQARYVGVWRPGPLVHLLAPSSGLP